MRTILISFAVFTLMWMPMPASAQANEPDLAKAQSFVVALADEAIIILSSETTRAGREASFSKLLNEKANMRRIARFTLGQFGRKMSKPDVET